MKAIYVLISLFFMQSLVAQNETTVCEYNEGYDVVLVMGASNTHYGYPLETALDTVNPRIFTLLRHNGLDYRVSSATSVLDSWTRQTNRNSFAVTFSNLYVNQVLNHNKRKVLLIPTGYAGSSIQNWTKNQNLYTDAMNRVNYVLENVHGSRLVAVLWHQGESNVGWAPYQATLDQMVVDMRSAIKQDNIQEVPFILGGMVPYWVNAYAPRKEMQQIIKDTPNRVINTGYADPESPTLISKPNNGFDDMHFDSAGQREMGIRYFETFLKMNRVAFKLAINRYHEVEYMKDATKAIFIDKIDVTANKNIRSAVVYDVDNNVVQTVENPTANKITINVEQLPLSTSPYKLQITDAYNFVHEFVFYR